jgi:hypothetical protein
MKTLTIPKRFGYPTLDITVNGIEYTVKSGEEITVEDQVAEAIENAIALEPKHERYFSKLAQLLNQTITELSEEDFGGTTKIAPYAIAYCSSLESIEIPSSVTAIETSAFHSCTRLKSVEIPNGVTSIGNYAFYNCKSLENVEIASNVTSIGGNAFELCPNLSRVYLPTKPPTLGNINAFNDIKADCVFYCKTQASLDEYKAATNWSTLTGTYSFVVE